MNSRLSWYPGHIKVARQKIREKLSKIDILIEIIDARAPFSSNSGIFRELSGKSHFLVVNKCDLISRNRLDEIKKRLCDRNIFFISALDKKSIADLMKKVRDQSSGKIDKLAAFGFRNKASFVMIAGMPNVGKTQLIKQISGKKKLSVANRPGVTRDEQWISWENLRILDTPGVLYPEMSGDDIVYKLAVINCIEPSKIGYEDVLEFFYTFISSDEKRLLCDFYNVSFSNEFEDFIRNFEEVSGINGVENIAPKIFSDYNKGKFKEIILDRINEDI